MTINYTTLLSNLDWENLNGNDTYVQMLRNKCKVSIEKDKKIPQNAQDFHTEDDSLLGAVLDYLKEVPEDLVYYDIEDIYGHKDIDLYFASPIDKENFYHYYNTLYSIEKTIK